MAHAISRSTGTIGVCFGTVGPGATNLVPGVAAAWADNVPLLVITANNQSDVIDPGEDLLQSASQLDLYKPITKWNAQIRDPDRAPELIRMALQIAVSGRPGPVHLDIPCDIGLKRIDISAVAPAKLPISRPAPEPAFVAEAAEWLRQARRPLLLAGGVVARADGTEAFRRLLSLTGFPATTTLMGKGIVPPDSPSNVGCGGFLGGEAAVKATQEADVILAVGCKFSTWTLVDKEPLYRRPPDQKIIQIDIEGALLGKNTRIDLGIVSDAKLGLEALASAIGEPPYVCDPGWVDEIALAHKAYGAKVNASAELPTTSSRINEAAAARELGRLIDRGAGWRAGHGVVPHLHPSEPAGTSFVQFGDGASRQRAAIRRCREGRKRDALANEARHGDRCRHDVNHADRPHLHRRFARLPVALGRRCWAGISAWKAAAFGALIG